MLNTQLVKSWTTLSLDSDLDSTYQCPIQELSVSDLTAEIAAHIPC